jgi:hypothetical protein
MGRSEFYPRVMKAIAYELGEEPQETIERLTKKDFQSTLQAIEVLRKALGNSGFVRDLDKMVEALLQKSEIDLGIRWSDGYFLPSGAKELDEELVNASLKWLREKGYETVQAPFEKSLRHLLRARANLELLSDVVTDAYEALESLAKIACGNEKTLDANRESFVSLVKASEEYKTILKDYCFFAHKIRHGASSPDKKPVLTYAETESFVYLTGLFIRLVISAGFSSSATG